jgi:hypothetical protein
MVMRGKTARSIYALLVMVIAVALAGCATAPTASTQSPDNYLTAAGFKTVTANKPAQQAYLKRVPDRKLLAHQRNGTTRYVFVDQQNQKVYVGDEAAFQQYLKLANQANLEQQHLQAEQQESDPEFWTMWMDSQGGP